MSKSKSKIPLAGILLAGRLLALVSALAAHAPGALAQPVPNADGSPRYGAVALDAPVDIEAGGADTVAVGDVYCPGYFRTDAPDATLQVRDAAPLRLFVRSNTDTVLLARTPGGAWLCNDDSDGVNAALDLDPAEPGTYAVWVGTFSEATDGAARATLYASAPGAAALDLAATPVAGSVSLEGGFMPDPHAANAPAVGGPFLAALADPACSGFVAAAPTLNLHYDADGTRPLYLYARADSTNGLTEDLTLAVNLPDGTWACNDDAEGTNPGLKFDAPMAGLYQAWVGTYSSRARNEVAPAATLFVSEAEGPDPSAMVDMDFEGMDFPMDEGYSGGEGLDLGAEPAFGALDLAPGFDAAAATIQLQAGGPDAMSVTGPGCAGYITSAAPSVNVQYAGGGARLALYVRSDVDATLLVNLPSGEWICNDDYDALNPALVFDQPEAGLYNVWVGAYTGGEPTPATFVATEGEPFAGQ